jgi:RimJ/RimL family protein N-acetyltransferase
MSEQRSYPRHVKTDAGDIEIRLMSPADEAAMLAFGKGLPTHDLLFLPRNISEPKVLSAWVKEIERGAISSLLAVRDGKVVGCGTLVRDPHSWSPHVGEIRMVVSLDVRGKGVGRALSQETFALALGAGLEKLSVQMTVDQQAAIALFESLGFKAEALLRDHVRDVDGKTHDIVVLGHILRRCRPRWKPMGCQAPSSTKKRRPALKAPSSVRGGRLVLLDPSGQGGARLPPVEAVHDFVILQCNKNIASHH